MHLSQSNRKMKEGLLMEDFKRICYPLKLNTSGKENIYVTQLATLKNTTEIWFMGKNTSFCEATIQQVSL